MYCNGPPLKRYPAALSIQIPRNLVISNTSTFSRGRLLAGLISIIIHQEPIALRQKISCAHTTVFSQTSLFLDRFSREFWISSKAYKSVIKKPETRKKSISDFFISFFLVIIALWMRTNTERCFHNRCKKCSKMMLKITWSVKTPLHRVRALSICLNWPARPLLVVMRISLLMKITQSDQSNPINSLHEGNGFSLLEKAYFIVKVTGPAMVQPASFEQPSPAIQPQ